MIKIGNIQIKVSKKFSNNELLDLGLKKISKRYHIKPQDIKQPQIIRKSIDARFDVCYSLTLAFNTINEDKLLKNVLDVLDNETIAEKTGLDIDLIEALRI